MTEKAVTTQGVQMTTLRILAGAALVMAATTGSAPAQDNEPGVPRNLGAAVSDAARVSGGVGQFIREAARNEDGPSFAAEIQELRGNIGSRRVPPAFSREPVEPEEPPTDGPPPPPE